MVLALIIATFFWRMVVASQEGMDWHYIYWRTDTRIDSILFGVLLTGVMALPGFGGVKRFIASYWGLTIGIILMTVSVVYRNEFFRMSARYTVQGAGLMLIIGFVVYSSAGMGKRARAVLDLAPMLFISRISYSLYLWHLTLIMFMEHVLGRIGLPVGAACFVGSLAIATLSYYLIETPFLKLRRRLGSHATI